METKEKIIIINSKAGKDFVAKMQSRKTSIAAYFNGELTLSELHKNGVRFVRTI